MKEVNFLEACDALASGECKEIEDEDGKFYKLRDGIILDAVVDSALPFNIDNLLGEWKLIGVKKKVVIENIRWEKSGAVFPSTSILDGGNWESFLNKPQMKMTLEWEE